jgi:hypothetical protein
MNCALGIRGRLADLNAICGGATGRAEIWRIKGGMGDPRAQGDRLSEAWSLKYVLFYSLQLFSETFLILRSIEH